MGIRGLRVVALVAALLALHCKKDRKAAPAPPAPAARDAAASAPVPDATVAVALDDAGCLRLLDTKLEFGGPAGQVPANATRTEYAGKKLALRGYPGSLCTAVRSYRWCAYETTDGDGEPECEGDAEITATAMGLVSPAGKLVDTKEFSTDGPEGFSAAFEPVAIAPGRDAVQAVATKMSPETDLSNITIYLVDGGKLQPVLYYTTGVDDGYALPAIKHRITREVVRGYYVIEVSVDRTEARARPWDDDDDEADAAPKPARFTARCTMGELDDYECTPELD